jgi:adenosylhomocysteine nucleosidase
LRRKSFPFPYANAILLYSDIRPPYALSAMLLIVAALEEELEAGLAFCRDQKRIRGRSVNLWQAERGGKTIYFLKAGVGPKRSAASLDHALTVVKPGQILAIGYAGALDASLKLGSLVAVRRALAISLDKDQPGWEHARLDEAFELANCDALARSAKSAGLTACTGDVLTSSYVLGEPAHKRLLYDKFHASIVDMETAALARVALARAVSFGCIRAVSDEVEDSFLAPFSHDASTNVPDRVKKFVGTGMIQTFREWRSHAAVAKESLCGFFSHYLEEG